MKRSTPLPRAFVHRAGVRIAGTTIACDTSATPTELVFLSHAGVGRGAGRPPRGRAGRQQVLTTEATLALMGRAAEPLRGRALVAEYGRPFVLGELRVELFPTGHLPGAAGLLVETGERRIVYAGRVCTGAPTWGATATEVRPADALCLDASFGDPRFTFPPREEALAAAARFVEESLVAGRAPVLLVPPFAGAMDVAAVLDRRGMGLRAHRQIVQATVAFRTAGVVAPPLLRFGGKLAPGEVLLWPPGVREPSQFGRLNAPAFALLSAGAGGPDAVTAARADLGIAYASQAGHDDLVAYARSTGAHEVALVGAHAEALSRSLRAAGHDAYALGPPDQMQLFAD